MKNRILATLMILALLTTVCMASAFAAEEVTWADYQAYLIATIGAGAPDKAELEAQVGALNSWADVDPSVSPFDMFFGTGTFAGQVMTWDEFVAAGGQGGAALDIAPQVADDAAGEAPADMPEGDEPPAMPEGEAPMDLGPAPEEPAEIPMVIAPAPDSAAADDIVVSFNIHDDVTLAPGQDLVFYISCDAPVDLGAEPAVSCTCDKAEITYSDVTLGGPNSYPTAELVTISGIDAPCTVTVWYDNSVADQPPALYFNEDIDAALASNAAMSAARSDDPAGDPGAAAAEPATAANAPAAEPAPAGGPVGPATGSNNAVVVLLAVCVAGLGAVCVCSKKRV